MQLRDGQEIVLLHPERKLVNEIARLNHLYILGERRHQRRERCGLRIRSVCEFSLCLSRACLGKKMAFIHSWLKNTVFSPPA
jgi:hypothetical protein